MPRRRPGPGSTPRNAITCRPSRGGRMRSSSSCSRSSRDALLELVDAPVQRPRLRLVARRAVLTDEVVERLEQRTGVAHVAAHRSIGPSHRIGVDAQMEIDEARDVVDDLGREPERAQPLLRHARADDLVVVEADTARTDRARLRLADVVQERGETHAQLGTRLAHDCDRVGEHVLVLMDRVLLELHGVELGQELVGQAGAAEEPQPGRRVGEHQELRELVANALRARRSPCGRAAPRPPPRPRRRARARRRR